jgi:hypothetical protein
MPAPDGAISMAEVAGLPPGLFILRQEVPPLKSLLAPAAMLLATLTLCPARADMVDHAHVEVSAYASRSEFVALADDGDNVAEALAVNYSISDVNGHVVDESRAQAQAFAGFLRVSSSSRALPDPGSRVSEPTGGISVAMARWDDTLFLTSPLLTGDSPDLLVRLQFYITGTMGAAVGSSGANRSAHSDVGFTAVAGVNFFGGAVYIDADESGESIRESGWSDPAYQFGVVSTIMNVDVPYEFAAVPEGLDLHYELRAYSMAVVNSSAHADFFNTAKLHAVLLVTPDGEEVTPESLGYGVSFASGMPSPNAVAVPEPTSLAILGIGIAGMLGYGLRRRMARRV